MSARWLRSLMVPVALAALLVPGSVTAKEADFKLGPGKSVFWDGEHVERAHVPHPDSCGTTGPCWEYRVALKENGGRLRVALGAIFQDPGHVRPHPDNVESAPEMIFLLQLIDPNGSVSAEGSTGELFTAYGVELFVERPQPGTWTVRVVPTSVIDMAFRMRAKLERANPGGNNGKALQGGQIRGPVALSPNLRIIPPFEFNFHTPTASYRPGVGTPAFHASCMAEEIAEALEEGWPAPHLCLRYSMGVENVGPGPLRLMVSPRLFGGEPTDQADVTQRRLYTDSEWRDEAFGSAGVARFHAYHLHYHYQNMYTFQLLRVTDGSWRPGDAPPELAAVGPGRKLGAFPADELIADWHRFYQGHRGEYGSSEAEIALQAGWGDIYEWNRGGNYSDFPAASPGVPLEGFYVLRGVTDAAGLIAETDETDNVGYALIEVGTDGMVDLLERGYGRDPWDPEKLAVTTTP